MTIGDRFQCSKTTWIELILIFIAQKAENPGVCTNRKSGFATTEKAPGFCTTENQGLHNRKNQEFYRGKIQKYVLHNRDQGFNSTYHN